MVIRALLTLLAFTYTGYSSVTEEVRAIKDVVESIGVQFLLLGSHPECRRGLYGFYVPGEKVLIICGANHGNDTDELLATVRHEAWHAAQDVCNKGKAALPDKLIRAGLTMPSKEVLHQYHPKQQRAEAEARVVERIHTAAYLRGFRTYCKLG